MAPKILPRALLACALLFWRGPSAFAQSIHISPTVLPTLPNVTLPTLSPSVLPVLSPIVPALPSPRLSPDFSPAVPPALREDIDRIKAGVTPGPSRVGAQLVRAAGASEAFVAQVRAQLDAAVLPQMLSDILKDGYIIQVKDHLSQDRPDLSTEFDYTGGLHDWGPLGNFIMIAEHIKSIKTGEWMESQVWRNAVVHECGHAVDHVMKATDMQEYRDAWEADFLAMPDAVKSPTLEDGKKNPFYYFVRPTADGRYDRSRQETWAEGFDILRRGEASAFNYANFQEHFPKTLAAIRRILAARYGPSGA